MSTEIQAALVRQTFFNDLSELTDRHSLNHRQTFSIREDACFVPSIIHTVARAAHLNPHWLSQVVITRD